MYFHWLAATGVLVSKTASMDRGSSTAKRLEAASGAIGAGSRAISSAHVMVSTPRSAEKTMSLRCRDFFFTLPVRYERVDPARERALATDFIGQPATDFSKKIARGMPALHCPLNPPRPRATNSSAEARLDGGMITMS